MSTSRSRSKSPRSGGRSTSSGGRKPWIEDFVPGTGPKPWDKYKEANLYAFAVKAGLKKEFVAAIDAEKERLMAIWMPKVAAENGYDTVPAKGTPAYKELAKKVGSKYSQDAAKFRYNWILALYNSTDPVYDLTGVKTDVATNIKMDVITFIFDSYTKRGAKGGATLFNNWATKHQLTEDQIKEIDIAVAAHAKAKPPVITNRYAIGKLLRYVAKTPIDAFQATAMEHAARLLKVKSFSSIKKSSLKLLDKVKSLKKMILDQYGWDNEVEGEDLTVIEGEEKVVATRLKRAISPGTRPQAPLTLGQLYAMKATELKALGKEYGITKYYNKNKPELIADLILKLNLEQNVTKEDVLNDIKRIMKMTNLDAALKEARNVRFELLGEKGSAETVINLGKKLELSKYPDFGGKTYSADRVIKYLTGKSSSRTTSREKSQLLRRGGQACKDADLYTVQKIAQDLNINTLGIISNKDALCEEIEKTYMAKFSQSLLTFFPQLEAVIKAKPTERNKALKALSQSMEETFASVEDVLRKWITYHYTARAERFYPGRVEDVRNFIDDGSLPTNEESLRQLGMIFSDVDSSLASLSGGDLRYRLNYLYDRFVFQVKNAEQAGIEALRSNINKFTITRPSIAKSPYRSTSPRASITTTTMVKSPPRSASPPRSPRKSPVSAPFAADVTLEEEEEANI